MTEKTILTRYAEDHFIHGHTLSSWIVDYVDFEESLAVGSIAQEELAHAATLLGLLGQDAVGRDQFVYERPPSEWWPSRLVLAEDCNWSATVLRGLLIASTGTLLSHELLSQNDEQVRTAATTVLAEQELHLAHWESWVRLIGSNPRTREEFGKRGADLLPLARDLFGAAPGMPTGPVRQRLYETWLAKLTPLFNEAGLDITVLGAEPQPRSIGSEQEQLKCVLDTVRALRVGPNDGVRGVYR